MVATRPFSKEGKSQVPHRDSRAICRKIDAALDFIGGADDELRPYLLYQLQQIMAGPKHITLEDCTSSELMSLLAVLAPVFSRVLGGTVAPGLHEGGERAGKLLTLVLGDRVDGEPTGTA